MKNVMGNLWKRKLARCNPFDPNDIDIESAKQFIMPNSNMVYTKFRDEPVGDMDSLTLMNWASGDSGKNKFPHLETICKMVYASKFGIPEWREQGMTDEDILSELLEFGFTSARVVE